MTGRPTLLVKQAMLLIWCQGDNSVLFLLARDSFATSTYEQYIFVSLLDSIFAKGTVSTERKE